MGSVESAVILRLGCCSCFFPPSSATCDLPVQKFRNVHHLKRASQQLLRILSGLSTTLLDLSAHEPLLIVVLPPDVLQGKPQLKIVALLQDLRQEKPHLKL